MISLAGKAALVTGGSRGIGAATVKMFAQAGADVVFSYHRNREAAAQVEQEARKHGTRIESCKADLGKMVDARKLVDFAHERLGRLDILVANAGIWNEKEAPIEQLSEREWDEMIRVNLKSVYATVHHARAAHDRAGRRPHRGAQLHSRPARYGFALRTIQPRKAPSSASRRRWPLSSRTITSW